jgi:hypothetical protein
MERTINWSRVPVSDVLNWLTDKDSNYTMPQFDYSDPAKGIEAINHLIEEFPTQAEWMHFLTTLQEKISTEVFFDNSFSLSEIVTEYKFYSSSAGHKLSFPNSSNLTEHWTVREFVRESLKCYSIALKKKDQIVNYNRLVTGGFTPLHFGLTGCSAFGRGQSLS